MNLRQAAETLGPTEQEKAYGDSIQEEFRIENERLAALGKEMVEWSDPTKDRDKESAHETTGDGPEPAKTPEPEEVPESAPWGVWSVFNKQLAHLRIMQDNLPPVDPLDNLADSTAGELTDRLGRMGAALVYMQMEQGALLGRLRALKDMFEGAADMAKARLPRESVSKTTSESVKLQMVLARPDGEPLRELRRRIVELEACTGTQDGYIRGYEKAWETISRALTSKTGEMALEARR